ncbi:MAG: hypothetical protein JNL97_17505 [Verrucomicrobiales bacterium]|nr:hypothetical protein [Verrucomicrobiales bacterium]
MALSEARAKAKERLMWVFHRALRGFAEANDGRLPSTITDLLPHVMNTHVEGPASAVEIREDAVRDDILRRYRIEATGRLADQTQDAVIVRELAPVDPEFDTCLRVGHNWVGLGGMEDVPGSTPPSP